MISTVSGIYSIRNTRQKMSEAHKGRPLAPDTVVKLRTLAQGRQFPVWAQGLAADLKRGKPGVPHTDDTKRKIGAAHRGKVLSEDTKRRMSVTKKALFAARKAAQGQE